MATLLAAIALAACATTRSAPARTPGAPAPAAAVERFLQLAAVRDYVSMGWLFGTSEGPVVQRDDPSTVERRMYALATVLDHDTYMIESEAPVPGRTGEAVRLVVLLQNGERTYSVPFIAVRGPDNRWFVEVVDVEAVTNSVG